MKKEDLIIKWLDNNLSEKELKAFEQLDASSIYTKMDQAAKRFKAPAFDLDASYSRLKAAQTSASSPASNWKKYISGIAAALIIAFGLFFAFQDSSETEVIAQNSERKDWVLPDASEVSLNAGSTLSFNEKSWSSERAVHLKGEAFFKVAKGSKFSVHTAQGKVEVLGTQFTVNDRKNYFEVVCYEGQVRVSYKGLTRDLTVGTSLKVYDNTPYDGITSKAFPTWMAEKSTFTSVPYFEVVQELERQYNTTITMEEGLNNTLFTGSFTHSNLEIALQAITIPLNLSFTINGNEVVLKSN